MSLHRLTLILGGARSGKSRYAEELFSTLPAPLTYIATAQASDGEMQERISHHRSRRDERWLTLETPLALPQALAGISGPVLVDCLTLWLSNLMLAECDLPEAFQSLETALANTCGPVVLVSNEVGLSIVPDNALARAFRDEQGRLNQRMAKIASHVVFMVAGLPMIVKQAHH